ncbi:MAG TPA: peroxiredoxin [Bacteroidota bacterium]|nr:peroxiredoxin [Bacteroidota bacterium]
MGSMKRVISLAAAAAVVAFTQAAGGTLKVGDRAPDFTLQGATKDSIDRAGVTLSARTGRDAVILAFYPADWSGGCTKEMCTMRDNFADLGTLGATVFGISGDYVFSHHEWAKSLGLPFMLLSDHDHHVARQYESFNEKSGFNLRTVYVIDRHGTIAYIDPAYIAGSADSFARLKTALSSIH